MKHVPLTIISVLFLLLPQYASGETSTYAARTFINETRVFSIEEPSYWFDDIETHYEPLAGDAVTHVFFYNTTEKESRKTKGVLVYWSDMQGMFGIPARLRSKLSEEQIVSWYIHDLERSLVGCTIVSARKASIQGLPAYVVETMYVTKDRYRAHTIDYFIFSGARVFKLTAYYLDQAAASRQLLIDMIGSFKLVT